MGNFERLYHNKIERFFGAKITHIISIILWILITVTIVTLFILSEGGIVQMYTYPEEEYIYLETEVRKVMVNNTVDTAMITDKDIAYTMTYKAGTWNIEILGEAQISAIVKSQADGTLNMKIIYPDKKAHMVTTTKCILISIIISAIIGFLIYYMVYILLIVSVGIIIVIERNIILIKKNKEKFKSKSNL